MVLVVPEIGMQQMPRRSSWSRRGPRRPAGPPKGANERLRPGAPGDYTVPGRGSAAISRAAEHRWVMEMSRVARANTA